MQHRSRALLVALGLDQMLSELPNAVHPVVVMGRWLALGEHLAPQSPHTRLVWGVGWLGAGLTLSAAIGARVPRHWLVQGMVATMLLAYRELDKAVAEVQAALVRNDLEAARRLASWHLVSRPTEHLGASEVAAAAIESLAENLSDSVVAPCCWYLIGGLPALAAYRMSNTADAMWGYRNQRYEHLGKAAARLDDLLNWLPARLTALLLAGSAQVVNGRGTAAWCVARRDHGRTASPNAGWPMAAMAGALDTTLVKRDHYRLGDGAGVPDVHLIAVARRIARVTVALLVALLVGAGLPRPGM